MADSDISKLNKIQTLDQFNKALSDALKNPSIKTSWLGSRESFTLGSVEVKMQDIVAKFQELAEKDTDDRLRLLGDIRYKIVALDLKGDEELSKAGFGALAFRDLKNIGSDSHIKKIDDILNKYLFNDASIKKRAESLLENLDERDKLIKLKQESIREKNSLVDEINTLNEKNDKSAEANKKIEENSRKIKELETTINKRKYEISQKEKKFASEIIEKTGAAGNTGFVVHFKAKSSGDLNYETKNALRYLVQNNPKELRKIVRIIDKALQTDSEGNDLKPFKELIRMLKKELIARTSREAALKNAPYAPIINEIKNIFSDEVEYSNFYNSLLDSGIVKFENHYKDLLEILAKSDLFAAKKILEALIEETEGIEPVTPSSRLKKDVHDFCEDLLGKVNIHLERA